MVGDGCTALCACYAAEGEERDGDWTFWGLVRGFELRMGCFSLSEMRRAALSRGAALRCDRGFVERPMAEVLELEGARGYDGEA